MPPPASAPLTPDFLLLRPHGDTLDELLGALRAADGIPRIAIDIAGVDALEQVLRQGAAYAGCSLAGTERPPTRQPLPPQVTRICRLLNRLVAGAETGEIATEIKSDVGLGLRVLRLVNSAGMRRGREIESIDQALILLGRDELYRWLSVLLLSLADGRPASRALQQMALVRARLMELLAIDGREPLPGSLYTLGLASMLDVLLGLPRADAVDALALSDSARAALLDDAGPWSAYLRLARRIESGSAPDDDADAERFGGWPRVQALSADAWTWTATHAGGAAG